jgi:hypothetical protein
MASRTETGHSKNVASFEDLIAFCTGYGATYNPVKTSLKLPALNTLFVAANNSLQAVKVAKSNYDNATNAREIAFKPLKSLATKIVNALSSTDATQQTVDDARTMKMRIQGRRAVALKKTAPETEVATAEEPLKTTSVGQQSFNKMVDNFAQLIQTLVAESKYAPNENELKVATLITLLADLRLKNTAVINAKAALSNARIARDKVLYFEDTGLCNVAKDAKSYVKSLFGAASPQYKQISGLSFIDLKLN